MRALIENNEIVEIFHKYQGRELKHVPRIYYPGKLSVEEWSERGYHVVFFDKVTPPDGMTLDKYEYDKDTNTIKHIFKHAE